MPDKPGLVLVLGHRLVEAGLLKLLRHLDLLLGAKHAQDQAVRRLMHELREVIVLVEEVILTLERGSLETLSRGGEQALRRLVVEGVEVPAREDVLQMGALHDHRAV